MCGHVQAILGEFEAKVCVEFFPTQKSARAAVPAELPTPRVLLELAHMGAVDSFLRCYERLIEYHLFGYRFRRSARFAEDIGINLRAAGHRFALAANLEVNPDNVYLLLAALLKASPGVRRTRYDFLSARAATVGRPDARSLIRAVMQLDIACEDEYLPMRKHLGGVEVGTQGRRPAAYCSAPPPPLP